MRLFRSEHTSRAQHSDAKTAAQLSQAQKKARGMGGAVIY